jgi:hypothetical protein
VHAEHAVGLGVGQDFYKSIGLLVGPGAGIGREREFADIIGDAGGLAQPGSYGAFNGAGNPPS